MKKTLKEIHRTLKSNGKLIDRNVYGNFNTGISFYKTSIARFIDWKNLIEYYSIFRLENVMRRSLSEVYDVKQRIMEYDEYIILAHK